MSGSDGYRCHPGEPGYRQWSRRAAARAQQRAYQRLIRQYPEQYRALLDEERQRARREIGLPPIEPTKGDPSSDSNG